MISLRSTPPPSASDKFAYNTAKADPSPSLWISTNEFANLIGITQRGARNALVKCFAGGQWKGMRLLVKATENGSGQGGKSYQVCITSLPENLRTIWYNRNQDALNPAKPEPLMLPTPNTIHALIATETAEWQWKLSIIGPALVHPKRSHARGSVLHDIASKKHIRWDGETVTLSQSTLRAWIAELEETGDEKSLVRKRRPKGLRRTFINRAWDKSAPFPDTEKRRIANEIETYTRSLWASGAPGWHKVNQLASSHLVEISHAAGWLEADMTTCDLGRHYCERFRSAQIVAIKEKDAKRFADYFEPRIKRHRDGCKPMDIVIGDVHPVDIAFETEDGRTITPRMIAWVDWATGDVHSTIVFLRKGEGIKQEHIARSFVAMVQDWGLPRRLYLDNGSEYKWDEMMDGFRALVGLIDAFDVLIAGGGEIDSAIGLTDAVIRAKPYNAQAKYAEAIFANLEGNYFSMIPGWIGGNRMNKRTQRLGQAPKPFPGNEQQLIEAIDQQLAFYRNTEQTRGHLEGKSPNQKRAEFYAQGWQPYSAQHEVFLFAFSTLERPKVWSGRIQVNGLYYYDDCLVRYAGQRVEIRAAKWDKDYVIWLDDDDKPHLIAQEVTFDATGGAGAREQSRRKGVLLAHIKEEKAGTVRLDLMEAVAKHNAIQHSPPALPDGIEIGIDPKVTALADARKNAPNLKKTTLMPGSFRHKGTGQIIEIQDAPNTEGAGKSIDLDQLLLESANKKDTL